MSLNHISQNTVQGRIAIGERHSVKGYPVKLDYFIATHPYDKKTKNAPRHKKMMELLEQKYRTDKTKIIDVILVDNHPEEALYTNYMNYPNDKCNCRGDGENALRNMPDGSKEEVRCNYEECKFRLMKTDKGIINTCKPTGILTFIIPDAPASGGVWRFTTHSMMTIGKMNGSLQKIYQIRKTLRGLKVRLKIVIVSIAIDGKNQNVPTVEIEIPFSYNEIAAGAGTVIGTLEDWQKLHTLDGAKPNQIRMNELSNDIHEEFQDLEPSDKVIDGEIVDNRESDQDEPLQF